MTTTRFRSGLVQLARFRVSESTVIEPGDLLYLDGGVVRPAGDFAWQTDLATTRAAFAAVFVGIAHTGSAAGETDLVSADISPLAVYEAVTIPANFNVGDLLAPAETVSALASQTLDQVSDPSHAIARSVESTTATSPTVRSCFASSIHAGSANVNAAVG
ncbi:MAG: hypothetical protein M3552_07600 [Planctomycetota bacterium]|nr:hypothetical protein [Planctomycetaceae bacterium]MDQ3330502.1 hypothetical protein [Planctomycetota bacterium]